MPSEEITLDTIEFPDDFLAEFALWDNASANAWALIEQWEAEEGMTGEDLA